MNDEIVDCKKCICMSKCLEDGYFYCSFPEEGKVVENKEENWILIGENFDPMKPPETCWIKELKLDSEKFIK